MVTKAKVIDQLDEYARLPTSKRDRMDPATKANIRLTLNSLFKTIEGDSIPTDGELVSVIRTWAANNDDLSMATKNMRLSGLCNFFAEYGYVDLVDTATLRKRYRSKSSSLWGEKALDASQIKILLEQIYLRKKKSKLSGTRMWVATATMLLCGARIGQMIDCTHWILDVDMITLCLKRQKNKSEVNVWKDVPLGITLPDGRRYGDVLSEYLEHREMLCAENPYFLCTPEGSPLSHVAFRMFYNRLALPFYMTPHTLRHTAATITAQNVGVVQAAELLDHESIQTTQQYLKKNKKSVYPSIYKAWSGTALTSELDPTVERSTFSIMHSSTEEADELLKRFRSESNTEAKLMKRLDTVIPDER